MAVRLILVGPPGAGKGTQAELLCARFGIPAISTGAIFRAHAQAQDELGRLAESYSARGELVPDEVTDRMVEERLAQEDAAVGFLLDGYPRNAAQVGSLDRILRSGDVALDAVVELTADDDVVVQRLLGRASEQGRKDDTEAVIRHRIALYHETTEPVVSVYRERGLLVQVDGIGTIDEVAARIAVALDAYLEKRA
ncbi:MULTISPECIES: adenylate kinase [unclassified Actinobaculum]|uniref:adenylate kinase n=1 Tax=unclassified Actinobaculum TaxID=2609299 RepID=UPI000D527A84|nr:MULTISPECIES: adenylate kinase [unclassified Actinobaculum]AWE42016.1 adenylate kinase [Actinobaculum sp. 313]RTE50066.1 adenylate kinase [Actinobaculum sp. 352]